MKKGLLLLLLVSGLFCMAGLAQPKNKRPNILIIVSDDHAFQAISAYNKKLMQTPNIDRLAKEGMIFNKAYVTNSICGPSRAVILTGKYSHKNGFKDNENSSFDGSQNTFIKELGRAGYQTAWIGKWHLETAPQGFSYWQILPGQGHYYNPDFLMMDGSRKSVEGYVSNVVEDAAENWLNARDTSKPFCLVIGHKATHRTWIPDTVDMGIYDHIRFPLPDNFYDHYENRPAAQVQDMTIANTLIMGYDLKMFDGAVKDGNITRMNAAQRAKFDAYYNSVKTDLQPGKALTEWKYQRYMRDYLATAASLDRNIGRVLNYLDRNNLTENTLVIYLSDQGFYLGEHGWFDKRFMYEESFRTPMLIRYPGVVKAGTRSNDFVMNLDLAPTVLDVAGLAVPKDMQGQSIFRTKPRDAMYYHYYENGGHAVSPHFGVRTERYKLIRFYKRVDGWELYDLRKDPGEMDNLYGRKGWEKVTARMKATLDSLIEKYDDNDARLVLKGWDMVFQDEFNRGAAFDSSKWVYCERGRPAWNRFITKRPEYAYVDSGNLVLTMDNKKIEGDTVPYHAGGIKTLGKFSVTYGRVEVRAKFNGGKGSWPAIWMMPERDVYGGWPGSGEIDIMERVNNEPVVHQTIHNAAVTGRRGGSAATKSSPFNSNGYNVYGIEWTNNKIDFYLNNELRYTFSRPVNASPREWPFDQPFYLILNQSGGAGWPGPLKESDLPFKMEVDWVRVYKTKQQSPVSLIPFPQQVEWTKEQWTPPQKLTVAFYEKDSAIVEKAIRSMHTKTLTANEAPPPNVILLQSDPRSKPEGYSLQIHSTGAEINANDPSGFYYGIQTLKQIMAQTPRKLPGCRITDWPAFALRGFMHDNGRNFQSIGMLKAQLDKLSQYKYNSFHWHLTDNPAWRPQSKRFPRLNDPGNRKPGRDPEKTYSFDEIRELIRYARERCITVIPELDMPGHSAYFKNSFGFNIESEQGMKVLEDLIDEFCKEIPASDCPIIHIGSDEIHIPEPRAFIQRMTARVKANGRKAMVWNPGLPAENGTIEQLWRDDGTQKNRSTNNPYIDSYAGYLNSYDALHLIQRYFFQQVCNKPQGDSLALGGILCCWPDTRVDDKQKILLHNPVWPGALAYSEAVWCGRPTYDPSYMNVLPTTGTEANDRFREFEKRLAVHRDLFFVNQPFPYVQFGHIEWSSFKKLTGGILRFDAMPGARASDTVFLSANIFSPQDETIHAWIGFETPVRSNRRSAGIPPAGKWDANGGTIFINDKELPGPAWQQPGAHRYLKPTWETPANEIPYTDEEFYWSRPPAAITLQKGWNTIRVTAPKTYRDQAWMFAFVPVKKDANGRWVEDMSVKIRAAK